MTIDIIYTEKSRNTKTGPIPVTTSPHHTCPAACPLQGNGCYAEHGPLGMLWRDMPNSVSWATLTVRVADLPQGQLWRHNQAGDLPHNGQAIDAEAVGELVEANRGKRGFTYTHHDMSLGGNAAVVANANANGLTVNLSANSLGHADSLLALGIGPVATVLPSVYQRLGKGSGKAHTWLEMLPEYRARVARLPQATPAGARVVVCPATYRDDVTCSTCKLCAVADRKVVVGFPAHGVAKRKASEVAA